jgi:hypothetical protein
MGLGGGGVGRDVGELVFIVRHRGSDGGIEGGVCGGDGKEGWKVDGVEERVVSTKGKGVVEVVGELVLQGALLVVTAVGVTAEVGVFKGVGVCGMAVGARDEFMESVSGVWWMADK